MKHSKFWFIVSLIIFIVVGYLLISGSALLTFSLSPNANIPLGTFITWLGLVAIPFVFYFSIRRLREPQSKSDRAFALILKVLIGLAVLWIPVSYLLAGNISFSFTEKAEFQGGQLAMRLFWFNAYFTAAAPIALGITYGLYTLFRKKS